MPFERYLRADDYAINSNPDYTYYYQDHRHAYDDADCHYASQQSSFTDITHHDHHHPHAVQIQIPQFMLNGPPILAPGGGAEVLPAGLLDSGPDSFASSWFANSGFTSHFISGSTSPAGANTTTYHTFPPNGSQCLLPSYSPRFTASTDPRQQPFPEPPPSLEVTAAYISSSSPSYALSNALIPHPVPASPSALGLPVYSPSGFDILSILSRVVNRPNPTVQLGPVDLSCSFVIVDVRRYDCPVVYASPTFCHLTGYNEQEVLGRNCRFLQSPTGNVVKGEPRRFASPEAVSYMRKLLSSSKECQTTLVNYRKGGQAFINLVTVIPLRGGVHNIPEEADEVVYHIGFQVGLTEQPNRILDKLREGSYYVDNSSWGIGSIISNAGLPDMSYGLGQIAQAQNMTHIGPRGGRHGQMMSIAVSKELKNLIADATFTDSVEISTATNMSGPTAASGGLAEQDANATTPLTMLLGPPPSSTSMNRMSASVNAMTGSTSVSLSPSLSLLLLEFLPDFLLVLSLKGAFLYVAPSVRLVLGYEPQELVGRSISDVCHPADLVPLMRELKEGSVNGLSASGIGDVGSQTGSAPNFLPKSVDLLFRALPKASMLSPSREVRDMSAGQGCVDPSQTSTSQSPLSPGTLRSQSDGTPPPYVWLECRGRLHVEPGKGRKAIILSGRARWMPVVRWGSVDKAGGVGSVWFRGDDTHSGSLVMTDPGLGETSSGKVAGTGSIDPLEFWALLSYQGTFLVASASVRDVLGWGTGEVIGRSIWGMAGDGRSGVREHVEAELAKLDTQEANSAVDPPPTVVTTSLVHKELHVVPVRLVFYRTPQSRKHVPPLTSEIGIASTPLLHPFNNQLCPIVCQATVLSNTEHRSSKSTGISSDPVPGHAPDQLQIPMDMGNNMDEPGPLVVRPSDASLFEELESGRGSSWQYELQQLKFANQRLHEELRALEEGARASSGALAGPSSDTIAAGHVATVPLSQPCLSSSSTAAMPVPPQPQSHYMPSMHPTLPASLSSLHLPNSLHEQDPPPSEWSSLAGANGQRSNPLKRSWRSEDGPTT